MSKDIFRGHHGIQQKGAIRRCDTCNGRFGLIRHRFAQKQFCSKQCLDRYKSNTARKSYVADARERQAKSNCAQR